MPAHEDDARFAQDARSSPLEHRKVRVGSNRNDHRAAIDAPLEQCQRIINCARRGRNFLRPIATFIRQRRPWIEAAEARIRACGYWDITATGERQRVTRETRAFPSVLRHRRYTT